MQTFYLIRALILPGGGRLLQALEALDRLTRRRERWQFIELHKALCDARQNSGTLHIYHWCVMEF